VSSFVDLAVDRSADWWRRSVQQERVGDLFDGFLAELADFAV